MTATMRVRLRLILHGGIILLAGLLCGLPTAVESLQGDAVRLWHTAHEALIMMGVWMLASTAVVPLVTLPEVEARWLPRCLVAMGYGFLVALILGSAVGVSPFSPGHTPLSMLAFVAAVVGIAGAIFGALLTIRGAAASLRAGPASVAGDDIA